MEVSSYSASEASTLYISVVQNDGLHDVDHALWVHFLHTFDGWEWEQSLASSQSNRDPSLGEKLREPFLDLLCGDS